MVTLNFRFTEAQRTELLKRRFWNSGFGCVGQGFFCKQPPDGKRGVNYPCFKQSVP